MYLETFYFYPYLQEDVDKVDVEDDVDEVEELDEEHPQRPEVVRAEAVDEVLGQDALLLGAVPPVQDQLVQVRDDILHLATLPRLKFNLRF